MSDDVDIAMSKREFYYEGLCRLLRYMVGKTNVSMERRTVQSEWSLCHTIGDMPPWLRGDNWMLPRHAADAIERLRDEHRAACEDRDAYRGRYHKALAASVWKPGTRWQTYPNPQRSDGLFVAMVGDLTRSYQAVPDRCLSLQCQLPHYDAEAVVKILNEWTESDARRAKEESDE